MSSPNANVTLSFSKQGPNYTEGMQASLNCVGAARVWQGEVSNATEIGRGGKSNIGGSSIFDDTITAAPTPIPIPY